MNAPLRLLVTAFLTGLTAAAPAVAADIDFAHDIVPILKQHCVKCHTGDKKKGGLSLNTRELLMAGGESGQIVFPGKSAQSELYQRIVTKDEKERMPPEGPPVPAEQAAMLKKWIDAGLPWEPGFTFGNRGYEPPLKPRRPTLPAAVDGRDNPVDRIIDAYLASRKLPRPQPVGDAAFARRVHLDLIGLLPTPEELDKFLADTSPDKRTRLVRQLLARDVDYAEHWLTFWNDLLRNDYTGTGFITGGRKQITKWLYDALVSNMPYDRFARELIDPPTQESAGYSMGIRWRGEVSAGQTVEIQFAQSVGQTFLGINLKCASCHDSFIDRWKLDEAFGLAAIYATSPMEIHRCDKPIGKTAKAAWLFPEIGQVDANAPQKQRLGQLAALLTHADNGRFTRTIVNRFWHRLMGRGIVHPTDAMQSEPWSADLLDELAVVLADEKYDLKKVLELIATSQAYQSLSEPVAKGADERGYIYAGPRARRMTAEQFMDAVWQLTGSAPTKIDAPVQRGKPEPPPQPLTDSGKPVEKPGPLRGKWVWSRADAGNAAAGETVVFRKKFDLKSAPTQAAAVATCDNRYVLYVNGAKVHAGESWEAPDAVAITPQLKAGGNEIVIVAKNGGAGPNPAGLFFEARIYRADGTFDALATGDDWQWTAKLPDGNGKFKKEPADWKAAVPVANPGTWHGTVASALEAGLTQRYGPKGGGAGGIGAGGKMVRASLVKCDFLMHSLGRPNREQIVSVRPSEVSTLEAIDLSNGQTLADALDRGARQLVTQSWDSPDAFARWLYRAALCRDPSAAELAVLREALGDKLTTQGMSDALWSVVMLPEFQWVR